MHLKSELTFEEVQRIAQNLGVSLRQTMLQPTIQVAKPKIPPGVKTLLPLLASINTCETESGDPIDYTAQAEEASLHELEIELAHAHLAHEPNHVRTPSYPLTGRPSWKSLSRSPSPSVVLIPTRGWVSPGGPVMSEPPGRNTYTGPPREGVSRPALCFLCYTHGHMLSDSPRLPSTLQKEARDNRETWKRANPLTGKRPGSPAVVSTQPPFPGSRIPNNRDTRNQSVVGAAINTLGNSPEDNLPSIEVTNAVEAGNEPGDN
jgi:hypothetical protein